jgi:hypothetical protein
MASCQFHSHENENHGGGVRKPVDWDGVGCSYTEVYDDRQ